VRDVYDLDDRLLIVTSDRISAFDCILPTGIPDKGAVLTSMSRFWFERVAGIVPNHLLPEKDLEPAALRDAWPGLAARSMVVRKAVPFPIECVVRGYLAGSAWKEYKANAARMRSGSGLVPCAGVPMPQGLVESDKLPKPIFTPATKAATGHDENISFDQAVGIVGLDHASRLRDLSLELYESAAAYATERGIIIADTKFEFGIVNQEIILIDEALTPDSSRFWDASIYRPGQAQPSYDKQFVRDYLETLSWDKTPPAPQLPPDIVSRTADKYRDAHMRIVGRDIDR
jgi:phosphoribosylaminoimidazole-succinocarboxamide synthase